MTTDDKPAPDWNRKLTREEFLADFERGLENVRNGGIPAPEAVASFAAAREERAMDPVKPVDHPGPWTWDTSNFIMRDANGTPLLVSNLPPGQPGAAETRARIAAAPEMEALLEEAARGFMRSPEACAPPRSWYERVREVLIRIEEAKARLGEVQDIIVDPLNARGG